MVTFDFDRFSGTWYGMFRRNSTVDYGDCGSAIYTRNGDKTEFELVWYPREH